jgi:hypothetical protein
MDVSFSRPAIRLEMSEQWFLSQKSLAHLTAKSGKGSKLAMQISSNRAKANSWKWKK